MKRIFSLLLVLMFALCGCHRPDGDPTQTTTTQTVQEVALVTAYYNNQTNVMGAVDMTFTYGETYRDGTVTLNRGKETYTGTFTCDENYNINSIRVPVDEITTLQITCSFDDQHRLLSAEIWMEDSDERNRVYHAQYAYDSAGRMTYTMLETEMTKTTLQRTYNEKGWLLRVIQTVESGFTGTGSATSITGYEYDHEGHIQATVTYDERGKLLNKVEFTYTVQSDRIRYEQIQYESIQTFTTQRIIETDLQGNIILQEFSNGKEVFSRAETEYDQAGRIIRQTHIMMNTARIETTYEYTPDGRLAQQKTVTNDKETVIRTTFQTVQITH